MEAIPTRQNPSVPPTEVPTDPRFAKPGDQVCIAGRLWTLTRGYLRWCNCNFGIQEKLVCEDVSHGLCQECDRQLEERKCAWCYTEESSVAASVSKALHRSLVQTADQCTFHCTEEGCTWHGQYSDIARHANGCATHIYRCQFAEHGCQEKDTRVNLDVHILNCPYRERICDACKQSYSIHPKKAKEHGGSCPKRQIPCAVTLSLGHWQLLSTLLRGASSSPDSPQLTGQQTPLPEELATGIDKRTPINAVCDYGCGMIANHPDTIAVHYKQKNCPNMPVQCSYCDTPYLNKELGEHHKNCLAFPVSCPRLCGVTTTRGALLAGDHQQQCPKQPVTCKYCPQEGEQTAITLHQRSCCQAPIQCRYCGESMLRLNLEAHKDNCPETKPFVLAGHSYCLQPKTNALIYQRVGDTRVSHICIPTTNTVLIQWLSGHASDFEFHLKVGRSEHFNFQVAGRQYSCRLDSNRLEAPQQREVHTFHLFCVNSQGQKLCDLYAGCDEPARWYALGGRCTVFTDRSDKSAQEAIAMALKPLPENTQVFLILSITSCSTLFDQETPRSKRAKK